MKNEKPTIIILTPGFPEDEADSTCLPLLQTLLNSLKEDFPKLNIIVLTFHYPYHKGVYYWNGIQVISFNGRNRRKLFRLLLWSRIIKKLNKLHKETNIVGLLSLWCNECAWIGKRFSKKNSLKHYCWLWGQDAREGNKYVKRIQPSANELVALSDFLQSEFERNYSISPVHIIPPGIDIKQFNSRKAVKDIDILGAGSLIPLKQYDIFIDTISELKKYFPTVKAVLCGRGPDEYRLQQQIERLDLKRNITLTGEISHQEVIQLMQRSRILLHPSAYEGFGLVCAEALYAGAHVISFCQPMNKEIEHWHIAKDRNEMNRKANELLQSVSINFNPVFTYNIHDTAKALIDLYGID